MDNVPVNRAHTLKVAAFASSNGDMLHHKGSLYMLSTYPKHAGSRLLVESLIKFVAADVIITYGRIQIQNLVLEKGNINSEI